MVAWLTDELWFPNPRESRRDGLVAIGGDLSQERLLLAYRSGIFPWSVDPITWWSPDPRGVFGMDADGFHVSRSLARTLRKVPWKITFNTAFRHVMTACATSHRHEGEWISPRFIAAYTALHEAGHAHSVECWNGSELVGGVYGVSVGGFFAGESMFHRASDGSKVALWHLMKRLREQGFTLFDTQMITETTLALGALEIPRSAYLDQLNRAVNLKVQFR
jgi:leucyl/phenylalanyl-tRNA--protein transferase